MLVCNYLLKDSQIRLINLKERLKTPADVSSLKDRINAVIIDMTLAAHECSISFELYEYAELVDRLKQKSQQIMKEENLEKIVEDISFILDAFTEVIEDMYRVEHISSFASKHYNKVSHPSSIDSENLDIIFKSIEPIERDINIIYPGCEDGSNFRDIKSVIPNSKLYGITEHTHYGFEAKKILDKVALGSFYGSRISNDVFDFMFMEPPLTWNYERSSLRIGNYKRTERDYIQNTHRYLRIGGFAAYVLPFYRLHKDMCTQLSKILEDVQVFKLSKTDFFDKDLVVVMGIKKKDKTIDNKSYYNIRKVYDIDSIPVLNEKAINQYTLPQFKLDIDIFRGSVLDQDEMREIASASDIMDSFFSDQLKSNAIHDIEPLLPFNLGQIGLVLTSGCLDGIVQTTDEDTHIIKGRVVKTTDVVESTVGEDSIKEETISNKVEINMFLPDGTYMSLA